MKRSIFTACTMVLVTWTLTAGPATAVDTDGDGLLNLIDVPEFDERVNWLIASFENRGIQDIDGANVLKAQILHLANNQIASLERGDFQGATNLLTLSLNDNQITSIERGDFEGATNLLTLKLSNNQITSLESGDFEGAKRSTVSCFSQQPDCES